MKNKIKKALAVALSLASLTTLCSCSIGRESVDVEDYIKVTFSGHNGYAYAKLESDLSLIDELADMESFRKYLQKLGSENGLDGAWIVSGVNSCKDVFDVEIQDNTGNLSNGDKVVIEVTVDDDFEYLGATMNDLEKALKISIKDTTIEYKVEGLVDAKIFDISAYLKDFVKLEGEVSGGVTAEIEIPDDFSAQIGDMYIVKGSYRNTLDVVYKNESLGRLKLFVIRTDEDDGYSQTILYGLKKSFH